jgi:hypothetical protein
MPILSRRAASVTTITGKLPVIELHGLPSVVHKLCSNVTLVVASTLNKTPAVFVREN